MDQTVAANELVRRDAGGDDDGIVEIFHRSLGTSGVKLHGHLVIHRSGSRQQADTLP